MSGGGRERASIGVGVWKSSQKWRVQRSGVCSIAGLDLVEHVVGYRRPKLADGTGTGLEAPLTKSL